jgi:hypothetical protein
VVNWQLYAHQRPHGNFTGCITPRVGVTQATTRRAGFSGSPLDGTAYNVATYIPNAAVVAAGGNASPPTFPATSPTTTASKSDL